MKSMQILLICGVVACGALFSQASADANIPKNMNFADVIEHSLGLLDKSPYAELQIHTTSGSFTGNYVSKSKDVLVLSWETDMTHMKTGKEKIQMIFIKIETITAVSIYVLKD